MCAAKRRNTKLFSPGHINRFLPCLVSICTVLIFVLGCSPPDERGVGGTAEQAEMAQTDAEPAAAVSPSDGELVHSAGTEGGSRAGGSPGGVFYTFSEGTLAAVPGPRPLPREEKQPWTQQVRVVDVHLLGTDLYCAVNGLGVFVFTDIFTADRNLPHKTISLSRVFRGRTIGTFFYYDSAFYCHLYSDSVLTSPIPSSQPVALVSIDPEDDIPKIIPFSFQDRNPGWELALLSPQPGGVWSLAWKFSSEEKTKFRYSDLDVSTWKETEITEEKFLQKLEPLDGVSAPEGLKNAVQVVLSGGSAVDSLKTPEQPLVLDVSMRSSRKKIRRTYRFGPSGMLKKGEGVYERLECFEDRGTYYLLMPQGTIILTDSGGREETISLPSLPEGFVYTGFVTNGRKIVAFWEEQDFTLVGSAGICVKTVP